MKPKHIFCLALVSSVYLSGCASAQYKVVSDKQRLTENHRTVAEVTCLEATPRYYTTFRDRNLTTLAKLPRVRWSATFQVNQVLKGELSDQTFTLVDARDSETLYHPLNFKAGEHYTVGFSRIKNHTVKNFAVFDPKPAWPHKPAAK
jgi:hypothetical protein